MKENEKKDKYIDLAKELKKLWNMKVTIKPSVIGAFCTVTKGLLKGLEDLEIRGRVVAIQTTTLLRTARISRRVMEDEEICCLSNFSETILANTDLNGQMVYAQPSTCPRK